MSSIFSGLGVFAKEDILPKKLLGHYIGKKIPINNFTLGTYSIELNSNYFIEAINYPRTVFAMINDSRFSNFNYNCDFIVSNKEVEVWSNDFIRNGDELFVDYGDDYWINR